VRVDLSSVKVEDVKIGEEMGEEACEDMLALKNLVLCKKLDNAIKFFLVSIFGGLYVMEVT